MNRVNPNTSTGQHSRVPYENHPKGCYSELPNPDQPSPVQFVFLSQPLKTTNPKSETPEIWS